MVHRNPTLTLAVVVEINIIAYTRIGGSENLKNMVL